MDNKKQFKMHGMYIKKHTADLIHLVSVPLLINFYADNSVYTMIPSRSYMFLFV